jgi:hypothetical protein
MIATKIIAAYRIKASVKKINKDSYSSFRTYAAY